MTEAVLVIHNGTVRGLAGGPLSLAELGKRTTRRVSHIEFDAATDLWRVTDIDTGTVLYTHPDYDHALAWERDEFNRRLAIS